MNRPSKRQLGMESLETRDLMAGNVIARVVDGNLVVRGDAQSNYVVITPTGTANRFKVEGIGCTINNESSVLLGVSKDFSIKLGDGNDRLKLGTNTDLMLLPGALKIAMGTGEDIVAGDRIRGTDAAFSLGLTDEADADSITLNRSVFTGTAAFQMGDGDDKVTLNNFAARTYLKIDAGDGGDDLKLTDSSAGRVNIAGGAGNDDLLFAGTITFTDKVSITGSDDNDRAHQVNGTTYDITDTAPRLVSFEVDNVSFG